MDSDVASAPNLNEAAAQCHLHAVVSQAWPVCARRPNPVPLSVALFSHNGGAQEANIISPQKDVDNKDV